MVINVKIPTIFGILTDEHDENSIESLKAIKFIFQHFSVYEQLKFHTQLS